MCYSNSPPRSVQIVWFKLVIGFRTHALCLWGDVMVIHIRSRRGEAASPGPAGIMAPKQERK